MSDLAKAFAGLKQAQEPERPGTQAPKRGRTHQSTHQDERHALASMARDVVSFARRGQQAQAAVDELIGPRLAPLTLPLKYESSTDDGNTWQPATAKNSHPDYKAVKVFVRRETHKAASRKWEDQEAGDFSDLVELLLRKYLES